MTISEFIKHWYWRITDVVYNSIFIGNKTYVQTHETLQFKGGVSTTGVLYNNKSDIVYKDLRTNYYINVYTFKTIDFKVMRINRYNLNSTSWSSIGVKKTEFIIKHYGKMLKTKEESKVIIRNDKFSKL